jgi:hypothetical protein
LPFLEDVRESTGSDYKRKGKKEKERVLEENLQPGGGMHPPNPSLGRVWGRPRNA